MRTIFTIIFLIIFLKSNYSQDQNYSISKIKQINTADLLDNLECPITSILKVPLSDSIVITNECGNIFLYNQTTQKLTQISNEESVIIAANYNLDRKSIEIANGSKFNRIGNWNERKAYSITDTTHQILSFCWIANLKRLVLGTDRNISIYDNDGKRISMLNLDQRVWSISYDSINNMIYAGLSNGQILLLNADNIYSNSRFNAHNSDVSQIILLTKERIFYSCDATAIKKWNMDGQLLNILSENINDEYSKMCITDDKQHLFVVGYHNTIKIFQLSSGNLLFDNNKIIGANQIINTKKQPLSNNNYGFICKINFKNNLSKKYLVQNIDPIKLAINDNCEYLGVLTDFNEVLAINIKTGSQINKAKNNKLIKVNYNPLISLNPSCDFLYLGDNEGRVYKWNVNKSDEANPIARINKGSSVRNKKYASITALSNVLSGYTIYATNISMGLIKDWNEKNLGNLPKIDNNQYSNNQSLIEFKNFDSTSRINCIDVNLSLNLIACGTDDGICRIFDIKNPKKYLKEIKFAESITSLCFTRTSNNLTIGFKDGNIVNINCLEKYAQSNNIKLLNGDVKFILYTKNDDTLICGNTHEVYLFTVPFFQKINKIVAPRKLSIADLGLYRNDLIISYCNANIYKKYLNNNPSNSNRIDNEISFNFICIMLDQGTNELYLGDDNGNISIYSWAPFPNQHRK